MALKVVQSDAPVGAEIRGVDLSQPLNENTFGAVEDAYNEHGVIFFRNQSISPDELLDFRDGLVICSSTCLARITG